MLMARMEKTLELAATPIQNIATRKVKRRKNKKKEIDITRYGTDKEYATSDTRLLLFY